MWQRIRLNHGLEGRHGFLPWTDMSHSVYHLPKVGHLEHRALMQSSPIRGTHKDIVLASIPSDYQGATPSPEWLCEVVTEVWSPLPHL